jgi:hypothetical protein
VGRVGFEPTTNGLKGRCSTTELPTQTSKILKESPNHRVILHGAKTVPQALAERQALKSRSDECGPADHFQRPCPRTRYVRSAPGAQRSGSQPVARPVRPVDPPNHWMVAAKPFTCYSRSSVPSWRGTSAIRREAWSCTAMFPRRRPASPSRRQTRRGIRIQPREYVYERCRTRSQQ